MLGATLIKGSHAMKTNTVERALSICIKMDIFYANLPNLLLICQASECFFFFFFNEDE